MKIKKLGCDQFAGVRNLEFNFGDGLNILLGDNESGKSTMIDLLYSLFFQDIKTDARTNNSFKSVYFPKTNGAYKADGVDGTISFETDNGTYKLTKEWNDANGNCKLILPDGTQIRDNNTINGILGKELQYGKGLFDELIFSSQKREQNIIHGLLQASQSRKNTTSTSAIDEFSSIISKAVMETGGIAVDKMESHLNKTLDEYSGQWDFSMNMPKDGRRRGINNPWINGCGSILKAYYKMEKTNAAQKDAVTAEEDVERIKSTIQKTKQEKELKKEAREEFLKIRSTLEEQDNISKLIDISNRDYEFMIKAAENWPILVDNHKRATKLKKQLEQSKTHDLYSAVYRMQVELDASKAALTNSGHVESEDVETGIELERDIVKVESKIDGLNLTAKIRKLSDVDVKVTSALDGSQIDISEGEFSITNAVEITVPGIIALQLMPKGIDLDAIKNTLDQKREKLASIIKKYSCSSLKALIEKQKAESELNRNIENLENKINSKLNGKVWAELQKENDDVPTDIASVVVIENDIRGLCGLSSIDGFIGEKTVRVKDFTDKYGSLDKLKMNTITAAAEIKKQREKLNISSEIPEEFRQIKDTDEYDRKLVNQIKGFEDDLDRFRIDLSEAEKDLGEKSAEEYLEDYKKDKEEFEEKKTSYNHWNHIYETFVNIKNSSTINPMQDVEENFRNYLALLTDDGISLESIDKKLDIQITSGNHPLTFEILSEGTKDTISLAFRLAVLKHLYPNGGALAIFDDPFTDMDPTRVAQACKLIQEYAKQNQVIFVTCDSKYQTMLTGNTIQVSV